MSTCSTPLEKRCKKKLEKDNLSLEKEKIKITTFITEFGGFQYLCIPQEHLVSGDAYTRQYDIIQHISQDGKKILCALHELRNKM